jgi:glycerol-3-phosphate dehydrogenase
VEAQRPSSRDRPPPLGLRDSKLAELDGGLFDVLVIGGGINGAVSAAALTDRGLRVALVDRGDFAGLTSQESSNLVWGGFKYLQNYELPLVWKLCRSRNELMRAYPTLITEIGFLATLDRTAPFPTWLAALGSVAYWAIGGLATDRPRWFGPEALERREPVVDTSGARAAIEYGDAYLTENDARFVWSFVRSAIDRGAAAANYVSVDGLDRVGGRDGRWQVSLTDLVRGGPLRLEARTVVNAAGPLVDGLNDWLGVSTAHRIVYSKGIHLVVPRVTDSERVLAFFDDTQRLFFVIPMAHRSVIGTTDTRTSELSAPVNEADRTFLLEQINARLDLAAPLTAGDVIAERSGVRPLVVAAGDDGHHDEDWTSLSRKHAIEVDRGRAVVSIFGGKLTDCLNVGAEVVEAVEELGLRPGPGSDGWYGEPPAAAREAFLRWAGLLGLDRPPEVERAATMAHVLWRRHGRAAEAVLAAIEAEPAMAEPILAETDVLRGELALYREREMLVTAEDFLRRRTKLAMIHRAEDLAADPRLAAACRELGLAPPRSAAEISSADQR